MEPHVFEADELFDEDYLYFFEPPLGAVADDDTELICRLLGLEPTARVLDLACGHGRIANRLAARGMDVAGLDRSVLFLQRARAGAHETGVSVEYAHGDMRSLPWPDGSFDAVISWFTSFGYFSDEDNRAVLAEARRVLRPGARLLIEANNLAELLPRWQPAVVVERDGDMVVDRAHFDPVSARSVVERTVVHDGKTRRFGFSVRMFIAAELGQWLRDAKFTSVEFFDREGEALTAQGRRMIAVARR